MKPFYDPLTAPREPFQIGSLTIPCYGYVVQSEAQAIEQRMNSYMKLPPEQQLNTVLTCECIADFLNLRLNTKEWTPEFVKEMIPWSHVQALYALYVEERDAYKSEAEKKAQASAIALASKALTGTQSTGSSTSTTLATTVSEPKPSATVPSP